MFMGYEVLFSAVKQDLKIGEDAFVLAVHWILINNGFKCIGKDDKGPHEVEAEASEMLPKEWNSDNGVYSLLYKDKHYSYLLKIVPFDGEILVHFMRMKDKVVSDASFRINDYYTGDLSSFDKAYKDLEGLQSRLHTEILKSFRDSKADPTQSNQGQPSKQQGKSKERHSDTQDPLRVGPPRHPQSNPGWADPDDPFSIGRGDLDPLAGPSAGGMLMDPLRAGRFQGGVGPDRGGLGMPGRIPRGSVPPGARFDPLGPPDLERGGHRAGPDPDHMRPPGFEDDMFM